MGPASQFALPQGALPQRRATQSLRVTNKMPIVSVAVHRSFGGGQSQRPRIPEITPQGPAITANAASRVPPIFALSADGS